MAGKWQGILRKYLPIISLIALCLAVYHRTLDVPFIFDDFAFVERNPFIRDAGNYFNRQAAMETFAANPGVQEDTLNSFITRPISYLTFSLNYFSHGKSVAGYHLVNILIHSINVVLAYLLVWTTIRIPLEKNVHIRPVTASSHNNKIAFITAALFAAHPLMTNAVTYITQRMTSLVTLFYLASVFLYACYTISRSKSQKMAVYCLAIMSCAAAMLTKESAFTLPVMLALYDRVFCPGSVKHRIIRLAPFLLTMAVIPFNVLGLHNTESSQADGAMSSAMQLVNFTHISSEDYLLTQFRVVAFYLKLLLMPLGLSLEHDFSVSHDFYDTEVILSLLLHLLVVVYGCYTLWSSRSSKPCMINALAGFGILWYYISLLVESSVIPMDQMAVEYRTYLPSFGFFLSMVCLVHRLLAILPAGRFGLRRDYILWVPVICLLMYLSIMRNEVWRKPDEFWKQTISQYPKLARPYANLADYFISRGDLADAIQVYRSSIREMPYEAVLYYELGNVYILSKDYDAAIIELFNALSLNPDMIKAYDLLTLAYISSGRYDHAYKTSRLAQQLRGLPTDLPISAPPSR